MRYVRENGFCAMRSSWKNGDIVNIGYGKTIIWSDECYVYFESDAQYPIMHAPHPQYVDNYFATLDDMFAEDWEVFADGVSFQMVYNAMKDGDLARRADWRIFMKLKDGDFTFCNSEQTKYGRVPADIDANDWIVRKARV